MRNDLVGNVADYFKYGLLRALADPSDGVGTPRLGVVWFLDNSPGQKSKGTGWDYLGDKTGAFEQCDLTLFHKMQAFEVRGRRHVKNIASYGILPEGTLFYDTPLPGPQETEGGSKGLKDAREVWFRAALVSTAKAQLVFLDPNNGLEVKRPSSIEKGYRNHCFYSEVAAFWEGGKSLILFQRSHTPAQVQIAARISELRDYVDGAQFIEPVYFQDVRGFLFFIIAQPADAILLQRRLDDVWSKWERYIRRVT